MLLSKEVKISVLNNNKKYLKGKGYDTSYKEININIKDLSKGSKIKVKVKCDVCEKEKKISYCDYNKSLKKHNLYTCSSKCSNIKKTKTNIEKFGNKWASQSSKIKEKVKNTNLERWGTECTLHSNEVKEKVKKNNLRKFGCIYASQNKNIKDKTKKTNLKRLGVEYVFQSDKVKERIKNTNIEKWGVDNPMKNNFIYEKSINTKIDRYNDPYYNNRDKFLKTNLEKWGMYYTQTEEYKKKSIKNNRKKWGFDYPIQSDKVKEKVKKTKLYKYNNENFNNIEKIKKTNLHKWGVEYVLKNGIIRDKIKNTNLNNYGVENIIELDWVKDKRKKSYTENNKNKIIEKYKNVLNDKYEIIDYNQSEFLIYHKKNEHYFNISLKLLYDRLKISKNIELSTKINPIHSNSSHYEEELSNWLKSMNIKIERRNRKILDNQELDIFLPYYNIAIEFNGLYWHSDLFKSKWYHLNKTNKCKEKNINLIHVFEDDWKDKKEIMKSIIKNRINKTENKIYARKCNLKEVSLKDAKEFLKNNHIQGYSRCKYKLGLYHNNELISIMTFGKRKTNSYTEFELIRFCNKINFDVIGGASKLFKYFIKNYNYNKIVSYADISLFKGNLYDKLGFKHIHNTKPNYYWVVNGIKYHRYKYNKKNLLKYYNADIKNTEDFIMKNMGNYKIWSCGQMRFEYHNKKPLNLN